MDVSPFGIFGRLYELPTLHEPADRPSMTFGHSDQYRQTHNDSSVRHVLSRFEVTGRVDLLFSSWAYQVNGLRMAKLLKKRSWSATYGESILDHSVFRPRIERVGEGCMLSLREEGGKYVAEAQGATQDYYYHCYHFSRLQLYHATN